MNTHLQRHGHSLAFDYKLGALRIVGQGLPAVFIVGLLVVVLLLILLT